MTIDRRKFVIGAPLVIGGFAFNNVSWRRKIINRHIANEPLFIISGSILPGTRFSRVLFSRDGESWTRWTTLEDTNDNEPSSVAYGAGAFVAVNTFSGPASIFASKDGLAWANPTSDIAFRVDYGMAKDAKFGVFKAVGPLFGSPIVFSSKNGLAWDSAVIGSGELADFVSFAKGLWFYGEHGPEGEPTRLFVSSDGDHWTDVGNPFSSLPTVGPSFSPNMAVKGVVFGNNLYVALGSVRLEALGRNNLAVCTSVDGFSWSAPVQLDMSPGVVVTNGAYICFAAGRFVVGGATYELFPPPFDNGGDTTIIYSLEANIGVIGTSLDGVSWSYMQPIPPIGHDIDGDHDYADFGYIMGAKDTIVAVAQYEAPTPHGGSGPGGNPVYSRPFVLKKREDGSLSVAEITIPDFGYPTALPTGVSAIRAPTPKT